MPEARSIETKSRPSTDCIFYEHGGNIDSSALACVTTLIVPCSMLEQVFYYLGHQILVCTRLKNRERFPNSQTRADESEDLTTVFAEVMITVSTQACASLKNSSKVIRNVVQKRGEI